MYIQNNCAARSRQLLVVLATATKDWDGEEAIGLNSKYSSHLHPYLLNTHSCKVLIFLVYPHNTCIYIHMPLRSTIFKNNS